MKPFAFRKGKYTARLSRDADDILAAQGLRYRCFFDPFGDGIDADGFDARCDHVLIEESESGALVSCFRLMALENGACITESYSAQFYDLNDFLTYPDKMIEMGRFCIADGQRDPEILRMAWAMMTRIVDEQDFQMMFGCSSFEGTDPETYAQAFLLLNQRYVSTQKPQAQPKSAEFIRFDALQVADFNPRNALREVPSLLRTYLTMGGKVSDHAVIDHSLKTMHVFTALEVRNVPAARAKALRALVK